MANYSAGNLSVEFFGIDKTLSATLDNIIARIEKLEKATSKFNKGSSKGGKTKSGGAFDFLNLAKWGSIIAVGRRFGRVIGNIVQAGADYTETLNLWETAMGNNITMATEFVNKMNQAYGISEKTLMNAQAIFKNMLGSLGEISDTMAYALSEGITQMALDYASLYNVTFEKAFTKFQAALAGQVRPIRSVSGYDITENTLYQLYQSLGGEKTMRQLSRTEKQLLSIMAIFNQMSASGAVGDLDKTMESFANQSRVMAEAWQQVKTYLGVVLSYTIQESGLLTYINAALIFLGDTLKALAESMGAVQSFGGDVFESTTIGAQTASKAIDEVKGKLLDFDKFRSLSSSQENALGLDEKLLEALSSYNTILSNANNNARNLAEEWKVISGLFDEEGVFNPERWEEIIDSIESFGHALLAILGTKAISGIVKGIKAITITGKGMSNILLTGVIYAILQAVDAFRDGDTAGGILAITIGVALVAAFVLLRLKMLDLSKDTFGFNTLMRDLGVTITGVVTAIGFLVAGIISISTADMGGWQKAITIFVALATAIGAAAISLHAFKGDWVKALSVAGIVAGGVLLIGSALGNATVNKFAEGGLPDKGTMFIAGEAGAEMVYNTPSGQSGVANIQQIEQAMYGALVRYGKTQGANGQAIEVYLDGEKVYQNTTAHAKRRGNVWGKA